MLLVSGGGSRLKSSECVKGLPYHSMLKRFLTETPIVLSSFPHISEVPNRVPFCETPYTYICVYIWTHMQMHIICTRRPSIYVDGLGKI